MGTTPPLFEDGEQRGLGLEAFIVDPAQALATAEAEVRALREALTSVAVCSGDHCLRCRETLVRVLAPEPPE